MLDAAEDGHGKQHHDGLPEPPRLVYRMAETGPQLLKDVFENLGWIPYVEGESQYWNLWWKGSRYRASEYESCKHFQRLNHFPNTAVITRKDNLFRTLKTMKAIYGRAYDFFPQTFSLPNEYVKFVRVYASEEEQGQKVIVVGLVFKVMLLQSMWICKPADLSRGRKIFVFRNLEQLTYDCNAILQRYISNPLLISGYKFDLRWLVYEIKTTTYRHISYVVVRSYNPLNIYLYDEGLTRFATSVYDVSTLDNRFSHLTNTSINKLSPTLNIPKSGVGLGCKWDLCRLRDYCQSMNIPFAKIWERMTAIIILTLIPVAMEFTQNPDGCFELYGFDILIDEQYKPWLLEVNMSPALSVDNDVDVEVKKVRILIFAHTHSAQPLLQDVLDLSGLNRSHAEAAQTHTIAEQLKNEEKPRRRSSTTAAPVDQRIPQETRAEVGKFKRIYPFNLVTSRAKCNKQDLKTILQEVKKKYGTP
ncbi:putative tubulin polyglutamylase ttll2 [Phlyctochytrium bullatum]|nr:putative tubulin polyglutamylase ttll2 [Phlyctochytrium bullatum]